MDILQPTSAWISKQVNNKTPFPHSSSGALTYIEVKTVYVNFYHILFADLQSHGDLNMASRLCRAQG